MYVLKKRPLKKPGLKKPNITYNFNKNYKNRLDQLPDETFRNIYQFIFPIDNINSNSGLWCYTCGEYIPDYETCIEENRNCYTYAQISNYEKKIDSKIHCLQCFISEIYPEWEPSIHRNTRIQYSRGDIRRNNYIVNNMC